MIDSAVRRTVPSTRFSRPAREPRFGGQPTPPQQSASEKLAEAFVKAFVKAVGDVLEKEPLLPLYAAFIICVYWPLQLFFKNLRLNIKKFFKA